MGGGGLLLRPLHAMVAQTTEWTQPCRLSHYNIIVHCIIRWSQPLSGPSGRRPASCHHAFSTRIPTLELLLKIWYSSRWCRIGSSRALCPYLVPVGQCLVYEQRRDSPDEISLFHRFRGANLVYPSWNVHAVHVVSPVPPLLYSYNRAISNACRGSRPLPDVLTKPPPVLRVR